MADDPTVRVTAQIVDVARDFTARRGDRLMVVAGVCIGLYTGETAKPTAAPAAKAPRKASKRRPHAESRAVRERIHANILKALAEAPGRSISSADLAVKIGLGVDDERHHYRNIVNALLREKRITASGNTRNRTYTLTENPNAEAAE
jgi:hypothetical protein